MPIPGWKWSPDWYLKLKYATFEGGFFHVFMGKKNILIFFENIATNKTLETKALPLFQKLVLSQG